MDKKTTKAIQTAIDVLDKRTSQHQAIFKDCLIKKLEGDHSAFNLMKMERCRKVSLHCYRARWELGRVLAEG